VLPETHAVISGRYTRPEVEQSAAHVLATAPRGLNVDTFESWAEKGPLVDDEIYKTVSGRAAWKTFTPFGMWAIFVMVGMSLAKKGASSFVIALASNQFGVLGWPCQFYAEGRRLRQASHEQRGQSHLVPSVGFGCS